jgi:hypothetical protein
MSQLKLTADSGGGTVAIKGPASTTGNAALELTVPGTGNATLLTSATSTGKILQVVQTVKTDVYSTNSTSYALITGLTQAITATTANNKILINVTIYGGNSANDYAVGFQLAKDGTAISGAIGAASGNNQESGTFRFRQSSVNHAEEAAFMYLDTAADTNAHTYGVLMKVFNSGGTGRVGTTGDNGNYQQHLRCPCTITLMEVAA